MEILGNIKNYDWGKVGASSAVAKLAALNDEKFKIVPTATYSELWMGDHVSGPSLIKSSGEPLTKLSSGKLPYLFKVLSIRKALSIQVHPNKEEAKRLHKERPDVYKDPNHKPELAIALTPFVALCGFRPYKEIYDFCQLLPPMYNLLGGEMFVGPLKEGSTDELKACYEKVMTSTEGDVTQCVQAIRAKHSDVLAANGLLNHFDNINKEFPNDVGLLSLFFMNLIILQPGESIYLPANELHAYLCGDCIECMSCSDNVIRAGLTPKYKDVGQLIACLNYEGLPKESKYFKPIVQDQYAHLYQPPVKDFAVASFQLPASADTYVYPVKGTPAIMLVLQGERTLKIEGGKELLLKRGKIIYIAPRSGECMEFGKVENSKDSDDFIAYMAMSNN